MHSLARHEPLSSPNRNIRSEALEKARKGIEVAAMLEVRVVVLHASDEPIARFNKELSKARVVVEHTISKLKKFRNRLGHYDLMTDIVSGQLQDNGNQKVAHLASRKEDR